MKKTFLTIAAVFLAWTLGAQACGSHRYSISASGEYGYNSTWKSFGGADVRGFLPVCRHFEAVAGVEIHSAGVFSAAITARPKFQLPVGEIFIDASCSYRNLFKYSTSDLTGAVGAGYRMNYASVQIGIFGRGIFDRSNSGSNSYVFEPVNVAYRVSFKVRPASCRWNVGGGITNFDDYQYERMWQPMFYLDGWVDFNDNLSFIASVWLSQRGMFHQIASFYGVTAKAGITYRF